MAQKTIPLFDDPAGGDLRYLVVKQQPDLSWLVLGVTSPGNPSMDILSVSGLLLSTAGVADSAGKCFVTDTELGNLVILQPLAAVEAELAALAAQTGAETLLASVPTVNLNTAGAQNLYTVPAGKTAVVTKVVVRDASISLTTVKIALGYTGAGYTDVMPATALALIPEPDCPCPFP